MRKNSSKLGFISIILLGFYPFFSKAQGISLTETLKYLNTKFDGRYVFDVKNAKLTLECFKEGQKIRQDKAYVDDLDPFSIIYIEEETAIIIKCTAKSKDCIERKFNQSTSKSRNYFTRMNLLVEGWDEKSITGVQNALVHMIRLIQDLGYKSNEPFEQ